MGWDFDDIPAQTGRTALVTGANSGLGAQVALALARRGARVLVGARNPEKGTRAVQEIGRQAPDGSAELLEVDLASLASVERAAGEVAERVDRLDLLVNNAGIMMVPRGETEDGFERQLGTNHLGHFALTGRLLPLLQASDGSRVVTTSSLAAVGAQIRFDDLQSERSYSRTGAYGQSKLANLLFALELQRRLEAAEAPVASLAGHPGVASTGLVAGPVDNLPAPVRPVAYALAQGLTSVLAQSDADGALPLLRAATAPDAQGGEYYGPSRLRQQRGAPERVDVPDAADDVDTARRLWETSEDLTGVRYDLPA